MHELIFLQDLAIVMAVSAAIMIFCYRFHLPVVLGYIAAGIVIGPHTPPFPLIKDIESIRTLSEIGIIFLLFSIGLEFSIKRLAKVGPVSFFAANVEIFLMIWIGLTLGRFLGWKFADGLFLGAILAISSSTIIAKMLLDMRKVQEKFAQIILGVVIIDDILAILIIAVLSGLAVTGALTFSAIGISLAKVTLFIAGLLLIGFIFIPRLLRYLFRFEGTEIKVVTVIGLCFAASLAAAKFGFSVGLGAFLTGAIIAETKYAGEIVKKIEPLRDMFTAIFFVSVGMLFDPALVASHWSTILLIVFVTIIARIFSCSLATFLGGYHPETALKVGLGLAQIGEFSFIIARLGESTGMTSPFLYSIAVSVSAITTLVSPILVKNTNEIVIFMRRLSPPFITNSAAFYVSLIEKIGGFGGEGASKKNLIAQGIKKYIPRLVFAVAGGALSFWGAIIFLSRWPDLAGWIYWGTVGAVLFPFFMAFAYMLDQLLWNVLFLNMVKSREKIDESKEVSLILHNVIRFFTVVFAGLLFLAAGSFFVPSLPLIAGVLGLFAVAAVFLLGSIYKIHERVEGMVKGIFDHEDKAAQESQLKEKHREIIRLIHEEYPWEVDTQDFLLPYKECGANQPLRDLAIRSETGASVVAIYRDEDAIANPPADTRLLPGDVLLLMGDAEQIRKAMEYLHLKIKEPPVVRKKEFPKTSRFRLPEGSHVCGQRIRDVHLGRKTGVQILGIQRGKKVMNNPDPDISIEAGDDLMLFGGESQIEKAILFLSRA